MNALEMESEKYLESIDLVKEADEIQCINKIDIVQK